MAMAVTTRRLICVYSKGPAYSGWGHPLTRKKVQAGWEYLQVVKKRDAYRWVIGLQSRVVYGTAHAVKKHLPAHLSYIERTQLIMHHFNSRLTCKRLSFSKSLLMHRAAAAWDNLYYKFARPVKTLRVERRDTPGKRWLPRTPAMAVQLTGHIWTPKELLTTLVVPSS